MKFAENFARLDRTAEAMDELVQRCRTDGIKPDIGDVQVRAGQTTVNSVKSMLDMASRRKQTPDIFDKAG